MEELNRVISSNITRYRKLSGLTQMELAQKLNYSDKAISKWERGDGLPDINVLLQMSSIFGVSVNELCYDVSPKSLVSTPTKKHSHLYITFLSIGIVWLVATIIFAGFLIFARELKLKWLCFVYAIPVSAIVALVFNTLWGDRFNNLLFVTIIIWGSITCVCFTISVTSIYPLYLVGIPLQILAILWYCFRSKIKQHFQNKK